MSRDNRAAVPSPCTGTCRLDPAGAICLGCRRTLAEIAAWRDLDDAQKRAVLAQLPRRRREATGTP